MQPQPLECNHEKANHETGEGPPAQETYVEASGPADITKVKRCKSTKKKARDDSWPHEVGEKDDLRDLRARAPAPPRTVDRATTQTWSPETRTIEAGASSPRHKMGGEGTAADMGVCCRKARRQRKTQASQTPRGPRQHVHNRSRGRFCVRCLAQAIGRPAPRDLHLGAI